MKDNYLVNGKGWEWQEEISSQVGEMPVHRGVALGHGECMLAKYIDRLKKLLSCVYDKK